MWLWLLACASPLEGARDPDPGADFQVWAFTAAAPDQAWIRSDAPLLHGLSSLGMHDTGDGLALTGLPMLRPPTRWEEALGGLRVFGFRSNGRLTREAATRPESWTPSSWSVEDPGVDAPIDPQGFEGGFWYYAAQGREGDPAKRAGDHAIRSSPPPVARVAAPGLADPSPARLGGALTLFTTVWLGEGRAAVAQYTGEPLAEVARFDGLSVPFALEVEGRLWLWAQAVVGGRRAPVWSVSADGRSWSAWRSVDLGGLQSCTSPVMGRLRDGWLMLCVEERGGPR